MLKACNIWIKQRYDALDAISKAELEAAAEEAKAEVCGKQSDDQICYNIPVRDTPKAAQLKVIGKIQTDIASLFNKLSTYRVGAFIAYVPMDNECAQQKPAYDRNSPLLQAYFLHKDESATSAMLLRAKKFVTGELS